MKRLSPFVIVVVFSFFWGSSKVCGEDHKGIFFPLQYATGFKVGYLGNGCKQVTDGAGRRLLLLPRGQVIPASHEYNNIVEIPVKRVVTKWTTIPPLLRALGVMHSIVGVTTRKKDWHIMEIRRGMEEGRIKYLGESRATDYERLRAINPDVFFAGEWEKTEKLNELEIPFAVVTEYMEKDPLGRLEWIKFFAAFYDREAEAKKFFDSAVQKVKELSLKVSKVKTRPRVLWGFIRGRGIVYVPRADTYVARMISMAGGHYMFVNLRQTGSAAITLEEFYARGKDADIYVSPGTLPQYGITSLKKLVAIHPMLRNFRSIKRGNVWCFQPWYWESIDKTDEIIEDLVAIFHPELFPEHKLRHFLKLPEE